jgi:N-methylhydantoinase A
MITSRNSTERTAGVRVGCDIGGTFTDIVLALPDGRLFINKTSSTPHNLGKAIIDGLQALIKQAGVAPQDIVEIVHGTTTASNTILQKAGATTGLLTTEGFRDVLEIGRIRTPTMFDLGWSKPQPLAPRRYRRGIHERMDAQGRVVTPLDQKEVLRVAGELVADGVQALAICFLNSYINPSHELQAMRYIAETFPDLAVSASFEVLPEIKEYERTSTTVVNAYILPAMQTYLAQLKRDLTDIGIRASLQVMASNGGMMGVLSASSKPVYAVASGPAGGVAGAAQLGRVSRETNLIVFDMGGTTAKASIIIDGQPSLTNEYEFRDGISSPSRFVKGGGYVLKVPAVDIAEVGAGGGSLAWIDAGGLLCVGPESAGAEPGPACYGRGNRKPTVTDANMVLGLLNPVALAGGSLPVDPHKSRDAIAAHIGEPLGLDLIAAAHGIRDVANLNMARAIRAVTVERGRDPRDMTMIAFGGGGPLHAVDVAKLLGIRRIIAPAMAGVFCSAGMLSADAEHNFLKAVLRPLAQCRVNDLIDALAVLRAKGLQVLASEGYAEEHVRIVVKADLRYIGQSSELTVTLPDGDLDETAMDTLHDAFQALYKETFGYSNDEPLELVNLRISARGLSEHRLDFGSIKVDAHALEGESGMRNVHFTRGQPARNTRLIPRGEVTATPMQGPLVIESYDTTIIVPPEASARADSIGNIIIEIQKEQA